jgi:hypothetical protein
VLALRLLLAATFLVSLPFGLCSSSSDTGSATDQNKALKIALGAIGGPIAVPLLGTNYNCTIHVTHQPAAPQSPFHNVSGSCLWTAERQGNLWLVTFSETWFCKDWAATVPNYPDCSPPADTHEWQYQVDLASSSAQLITNKGPFAPDQHS